MARIAPLPLCVAALVIAPAAGYAQDNPFGARIVRLELAIERRVKNGTLPKGRAAFLRQDLARVAQSGDTALTGQGRLRPGEQASYSRMLDRVEQRLAR